MVLDDAIRRSQPQTDAMALFLRGKKRIETLLAGALIHTDPRIGHHNIDIASRFDLVRCTGRLVQVGNRCFKVQLARRPA